MTTDDLIGFWSRLGTATLHPDDVAALCRSDKFETRLVPLPWNGPIRSARAIVALINPGLDPNDVPYEQGNRGFRERLHLNLEGNWPYVYFDQDYSDHPGAAWALTTFGRDFPIEFGDRFCVIQLVAYHSEDTKALSEIAQELRSAAVIKNWLHHTVLPQVRAGEMVLVVGRGAAKYGVSNEPETEHFVRYGFP